MKTYLVGGAVRDQLLNTPHHERDWVVVGATPEAMMELGFQPVGRDFPVFLHPQTKEEYALARTERKTGPGYTGFACHADPSVTLEEDLLRRDLTINAMAQDEQGNLIDPYQGRRDIEAKILRHMSPAFVEDPLRVLRVARFAARFSHLGFVVAPETLQLMAEIVDSGELSTLPPERIWKELERALTEPSPDQFFAVLEQCGALSVLMPGFSLSATTLSALTRAADSRQSAVICFAVLFADLHPAQTEQFCCTLKAPNDFRQLALLVSRLAPVLMRTDHNAASLLDMLETADIFRKPERLEQLLCCIELLFQNTVLAQQLHEALTVCRQLDPNTLVQQGLKGKAIGEALRCQRIDSINRQLFSTH